VKNAIRNFYVLPCCLLLLNLCNQLVSYKAKLIDDAFLRTAAIMAMVLFGGSLVGSVAEPVIGTLVGSLHHGTRARWGQLGEILFLLGLGLIVFWLYYRVDVYGPGSILPADWRNPRHVR
jgi:hypothetical protein